MRWGNAREMPAGPQGGTVADVCIMKKRLFLFFHVCVEKQSIAGPLHAGPFLGSPETLHVLCNSQIHVPGDYMWRRR